MRARKRTDNLNEGMKVALKISSVLNLLLVAALILVVAHQHQEAAITLPSVTVSESPTDAQTPAPAALAVSPVESKPFRWSQLTATDYRSFIHNLREIGCPEPTVRAIVTDDVDAIYRRDRAEIERKLAVWASSPQLVQLTNLNEQVSLKAELQKMPAEEAWEIADLLGLNPQVAQVAMEATATIAQRRKRHDWQSVPIVNPLVFENVDPTKLDLNEQQIQAVKNLQQSFLDKIGGSNQDPNDPGYRERWQKAQPETDDMLRDLLGWTGFQNYQIAAHAAAAPPSVKP